MSTKSHGSCDEPQEYIAVLALNVLGAIQECVVLRIAGYEDEGAYAKARQICHSITANLPEDCVDPKDRPNQPCWSVLAVQKEFGEGAIVDLFLENDIDKLDSRWLANALGVRRCTEYWTKVCQGEIKDHINRNTENDRSKR